MESVICAYTQLEFPFNFLNQRIIKSWEIIYLRKEPLPLFFPGTVSPVSRDIDSKKENYCIQSNHWMVKIRT